MLSILIPVYNFDVRRLVEELCRQCERERVAFEVLCYDDGSQERYRMVNARVANLPGVQYREMPDNLGRAQIRNRLAGAARFEYLLFLDCDSGVVSDSFIRDYVTQLNPGAILYGGRVYDPVPPSDPAFLLHWRYGSRREVAPAGARSLRPYHGFMTNNFVVPRAIMLAVPFDDRLRYYGHEDTLFGLELKKRRIPILHLDNPLQHLGLEPAEVFLEKTRRAVANLHFLYRENPLIDTRMLALFRRLKDRGVHRLTERLLRPAVPLLLRNLRGGSPSLFLLDLYKLWLFLREDRAG